MSRRTLGSCSEKLITECFIVTSAGIVDSNYWLSSVDLGSQVPITIDQSIYEPETVSLFADKSLHGKVFPRCENIKRGKVSSTIEKALCSNVTGDYL